MAYRTDFALEAYIVDREHERPSVERAVASVVARWRVNRHWTKVTLLKRRGADERQRHAHKPHSLCEEAHPDESVPEVDVEEKDCCGVMLGKRETGSDWIVDGLPNLRLYMFMIETRPILASLESTTVERRRGL